MAHQGVELEVMPDDPSSIPGTHKWKERTNSWQLSSDLDTRAMAHTCHPYK